MARLDAASVDRRNKAIVGLKAANPGLKVAYCLPCEPEDGFHPDTLPIVTNAIANGAAIDYWNAMSFDYGQWYRTLYGTNMSYLGILTAQKINAQLQTKYGYTEAEAYEHMGFTPMIGQTDQTEEVFWLNTNTEDATVIKNFVAANNIPYMGIWSANRDNGGGGRSTQASPSYSGIVQAQYDFSKISGSNRVDCSNSGIAHRTGDSRRIKLRIRDKVGFIGQRQRAVRLSLWRHCR